MARAWRSADRATTTRGRSRILRVSPWRRKSPRGSWSWPEPAPCATRPLLRSATASGAIPGTRSTWPCWPSPARPGWTRPRSSAASPWPARSRSSPSAAMRPRPTSRTTLDWWWSRGPSRRSCRCVAAPGARKARPRWTPRRSWRTRSVWLKRATASWPWPRAVWRDAAPRRLWRRPSCQACPSWAWSASSTPCGPKSGRRWPRPTEPASGS